MIFASLHLYKSVFLPVSLLVCHNFEWKLTFVNKKLAEAKQRISWIMPSWQLTVDLIAWVFFCISVCSTIHSSVSPELGWVKQNKTNWMEALMNNRKDCTSSSSMMIHHNHHHHHHQRFPTFFGMVRAAIIGLDDLKLDGTIAGRLD